MTETDFRKARPAAERFVIFGEPKEEEDPNPWYTEPLKGDPFFDLATFMFIGRRLCVVTLSALGQGEAFRLKEAKVLQGGIRKWGGRYERLWQIVGRGQGPKRAPAKRPALLWKLGSYRVLAKFSDGSMAASEGEFTIIILDTRCLPPDLQRHVFNALVPVKGDHGRSAFKNLETPIEPPLFE